MVIQTFQNDLGFNLHISQNELLTYLWYLNLGYTLRGLEVIQKFNNDNNDDEDQYRYYINNDN